MLVELAHADDHAEVVGERRGRLARDHVVGLAEVSAALGVPGDHPLAPARQHGGRNLTRVGAGLVTKAVLGAELHCGSFQDLGDSQKLWIGRKNRDLHDVGVAGGGGHHTFDEVEGVARIDWIHLPVGGQKSFGAHPSRGHLKLYASFSIATPGSCLPSRYSNVAPPPGETHEKRPVSPSASMAAAVSPPPTRV